ncbi:MAG: PorP/SprF family type IX secretion system membrane protein [Lentimicrobiaceae bacterium]|nr:PorP/SprF family type IX secretion system membrane protein [Lentimicrobiaceae bacterium]
MTNKSYLIILLVTTVMFIAGKDSYSQQDPHFTHYMFNRSIYNPANFGLSDGISVVGVFRNQWLGFKDPEGNIVSPVTVEATADAPIRILHGGIGFGVMQDKLGFTSNLDVKLGYAFHAYIGNNLLSIGANVDLNNVSHDNSKYITTDNEPVNLGGNDKGAVVTDMAVGLIFKNPKYYISLSSNKVLETKKELEGQSSIALQNRRHYYANVGYNFTLPAYPNFVFMPTALIYSDGKVFQTNFMAMAKYNNKIWGGVGYRFQDAINLIIGTEFNDIEIGYAFDIPISGLGIRTFGSHEIMMRYLFKIERQKTNTGYRNTRFL